MTRLTTFRRAVVVALLWTVAGCAPHPAAGEWAADGEAEFVRLKVTYEGRAELFAPGEKEAGRHCFWGAEGKDTASLSCKPAFDTDLTEHYRLVIDASGGARLERADGTKIVRLSRSK